MRRKEPNPPGRVGKDAAGLFVAIHLFDKAPHAAQQRATGPAPPVTMNGCPFRLFTLFFYIRHLSDAPSYSTCG